MANSAGIYLQLDGQILLLCDKKWGQVPIGIGVESFPEIAALLALAPGDLVCSRDGGLQFCEQWIKIAEIEDCAPCYGPEVDLSHWRSGVTALRDREKGLAPLASCLLEGDASRKNWNPWCDLACPRLESLCRGIREGDAAAIGGAVEALLGLGPGLTPSADDVLCGLMYGLQRSPAADRIGVKTLKNAVCHYADRCTHPVSAAYLKAVAQGDCFSRMDKVWQFLTGQGPDCLAKLLEVGSSSGSEMLLGLSLAGKLLLRMEEWTDG